MLTTLGLLLVAFIAQAESLLSCPEGEGNFDSSRSTGSCYHLATEKYNYADGRKVSEGCRERGMMNHLAASGTNMAYVLLLLTSSSCVLDS